MQPTAPFPHARRHRVAVLVRHGLMPMELGLVHQVFGSATAAGGTPLYTVATCAPEPGLLRTCADFAVRVEHGPGTLAEADTVLVPASREPGGPETTGTLDGPLARALALIRPGTRIASVCTGAFVLAAAGLLDGRRATTHWKSCAELARLFPAVTVDPDVLYTDEGDVLTSAGEAAGIDLCLHLVRRDHGARTAAEAARTTVVPPHREGGQAQYIRRPVPAPGASATGRARAWALDHLDRQHTVAELAARESVSVRTFSRRFRDETGLTPLRWLNRQRLDRARELLEETDLPVDRIASDVGFGTGASLRGHLRDALGVSPRAYRATFRGTRSEEAEGEYARAGGAGVEGTRLRADL